MRYTVHLPVAAQPSVDALVDLAERAEELGYERAWLPETWGRNGVVTLTAMARATETIGIGSSIINTYSRSPTLCGQTAATLQEVAGGRFRMGMGPSGPIVIEGWHGMDFGNPLRRTREYVEITEQVLSGESVEYDGEHFDLSGFQLRCDPPTPTPAIDVAAMGPKAVELAGRFADGWHATVFTPEGLDDQLEDFRHGAELGDQDRDDLRCTLSLTACALEDGDEARELARQHLAFYIGGMGTYYRDAVARQGYEERAHEIAAAWGSGDREQALELIDDELLDRFSAAGTPERARQELEKFEAVDGLDAIAIGTPRGASLEQTRATIDALTPE